MIFDGNDINGDGQSFESLLGSIADLGRVTKMIRARKKTTSKRKLIRRHNHSIEVEL